MGGDQGINARAFEAMNLRVVFRAAARQEFESATAWYDQQRHGLGEEFIREIDAVVLRALSDPERYPVVCADVRKTVAAAFPVCSVLSSPSRMSCGPGGLSRTARSYDLASEGLAFYSKSHP